MTQKKVSRWVAILIVGIILTACISLTQGIICFRHGFKSPYFGTGKSGQTTVSLGFSVTTDCACGLAGAALA